MKKRRFGSTGFMASEVGLGCWQLGGSDWGDMYEDQAFQILNTAVDHGVNFLDTANVYGGGQSEVLIGRFLKTCSTTLFVATKLGRGDLFPDHYSEAGFRAATESSLKQLGVDALDLTQLHCVPTEVLRRGEVFEWLRTLQQEGKIKHFGASVESMDEALLCLEQPGLVSLQIIFNLFRQKPIGTLFPKAKEKGTAIIVRLPLATGALSGKLTRETQFPASDHRNYNRDGQAFNVGETFAGLPYERVVELADRLKPFVPEGMTLPQMAQRWILDYDEVSVIIPGASRPEQAATNAAISDIPPLPLELHEQLWRFYEMEVQGHVRGPD